MDREAVGRYLAELVRREADAQIRAALDLRPVSARGPIIEGTAVEIVAAGHDARCGLDAGHAVTACRRGMLGGGLDAALTRRPGGATLPRVGARRKGRPGGAENTPGRGRQEPWGLPA